MLTHSKLKPYQCEKCSKKFIDQRTLERHLKTHMGWYSIGNKNMDFKIKCMFFLTDNEFYECTLCSAKSGRKDNIRRHVRNLHADSEDELQLILQRIFDNFSKKRVGLKENKTEPEAPMNVLLDKITPDCVQQTNESNQTESAKETTKPTEIVRNNATSVIKFVGRTQEVQQTQDEDQSSGVVENNIANSAISDKTSSPSTQSKKQNPTEHESRTNSIDPIGVNLPSLEPLSFDRFPTMAPLPLLNTNTNLNVYRQLLSPYLKKPSEPVPIETGNSKPVETTSTSNKSLKSASTVVIDRPPKKMIEKYDIFRN